ncbi:MAG: kynureninase [Granulosicoccus sp.]|jgi:kynureninase
MNTSQSNRSVCRKDLFLLPENTVYLDGNSLGALPKAVPERLNEMLKAEWGQELIGGWNVAGWMAQPARIGNLVAQLIGAPEDSVVMGDTLSIKVYQALAAAIEMRPARKVILSDSGNFPTDLYMAQGLIDSLKQGHQLKVLPSDQIPDAIDDNVAVVMLTQVDYKTGKKYDMRTITSLAHDAGAVMIWDLAHSAGAIHVDIAASQCEFAVGCSYKYLNGGPGAPAFIYVRPDLIDSIKPALSGWLGHEAPFAFDLTYRPSPGIERMRVGTPSVLQMTSLETALQVWDGITMHEIQQASTELSELFILGVEQSCPQLTLISPRDASLRGSQVSFSFEHGYAAIQALIAHGVVGDFRAPNVMRFGFTPLYIDKADINLAVLTIVEVINNHLWDKPEYKLANRVT